MSAQDILKRRQEAAQKAHDEMLATLIQFAPCGKLTVDDVLFIARHTQTLAFEAANEVSA